MTENTYLQLGLYLAVLLLLVKPVGWYMARVFEGHPCGLNQVLGPMERLIYRLMGIRADQEMDWKTYTWSMLLFNFFGFLALFLLQRLQAYLPLNPQSLPNVAPDLAFNTAISFITNTNWQNYGGETTLSYLTQMLGLTVQNFLSAATGMAILVALIRGLTRTVSRTIGSFWVDLTRSTIYILLPLAFIMALGLVSQGVIQNFESYQKVHLLQSAKDPATGASITVQTIALGPVASQESIKELGTNGGGFFNVNSAHPFENPTPLSNFIEMLAITLIGAALCYTFGLMVHDTRQGWAILAAMVIIFVGALYLCVWAEQHPNPTFISLGIDAKPSALQSGGNMEGKETRFGVTSSAEWAIVTTATSCGAVNSMHDSFMPLAGLVPMIMMKLGEVVFGGVGSGLYGMLMFVIITVFISGLMVGRTPEYMGKKIESYEMKMASLAALISPLCVLVGAAIAVTTVAGQKAILNPGPHGLSEILYAFASTSNNNGSAFGGVSTNTQFYNIIFSIIMFIARFWIAIPTLAIAGSFARKKHIPAGSGTLPTHTPLFIVVLVVVVLIFGALIFIPALALGPIVEAIRIASLK